MSLPTMGCRRQLDRSGDDPAYRARLVARVTRRVEPGAVGSMH